MHRPLPGDMQAVYVADGRCYALAALMFMVYLISHASPFVLQLLITPACTPCPMELWKAPCPFQVFDPAKCAGLVHSAAQPWTFQYVPGAGDDEETWGCGLTADLLHEHQQVSFCSARAHHAVLGQQAGAAATAFMLPGLDGPRPCLSGSVMQCIVQPTPRSRSNNERTLQLEHLP